MLTLWAGFAAFATYFCMYAFRKAFAAGTFEGVVHLPGVASLQYKNVLIIAQIAGYCVSKFAGIKIVSELTPDKRARAILVCIGVAAAALALFAVVPRPWNVICLFANGLPLGMVWGLVFGFLEGRKVSDVLGAGVSASFIVASGVAKDVGKRLLVAGVSETLMPIVAGLLFAPALVGSVWMLSKIPKPTADDERLRTRRDSMNAPARASLFRAYAPGLVALILLYIFLTAYRDFRDNYAPELWAALGYGLRPSVLSTTETIVGLSVMAVMALLFLVRDNKRALIVIHFALLAGALIVGLSTLAFEHALIGPRTWMTAVGLGLYLGYVPYNCVLFDRLLASLRVVGTAGFLIYVADAFGYLGTVATYLAKDFFKPNLPVLEFFKTFSYAAALLCSTCAVASMLYFARRNSEPQT